MSGKTMKGNKTGLVGSNLSRLLGYPFHPFVFAIYPILYQMGANISEVSFGYIYRPLFVSLVMVVLLLFSLRALYHDWLKAALVSTILLVLFYSYGHVYIALKGITLGGFNIFRHRTLIPVWVIGGFLVIWLAARKAPDLATITSMFNAAGLFLLIVPSYQLISHPFQSRISQSNAERDAQTLALNVAGGSPDIYYIILDGYGRSDVLKNEFGFDNSDFLNSLGNMGFYVAECSQSNYAQTQVSLASSLNFNYIDELGGQFIPGTNDRTALAPFIKHSALRKSLEAAGYKTVAFATGFDWTQLDDADYYLGPQSNVAEMNEFEYLLIDTTLARIIQDARLGEEGAGSELYRERTLFVLDKLDKLSYIKEPKFVFAHLIIPHHPYVFGPTGGPVEPGPAGISKSEQSAMQYRDQAIYISSRMREIIPRLIANSTIPPIIVIQGDHGPTVPGTAQRRMKILSVYYLPGSDAALYPTITPVNTFRVIFNSYFGQNLELLDDLSLYSSYGAPFRFKPIPNSCTK
jgi:hypothetical protein